MKLAVGQKLSTEEQLKLLSVLCGFCPDCMEDVERLLGGGKEPATIIREILWNWAGQLKHGAECPAEDLARWKAASKSIPSGAPAAGVGAGETEESWQRQQV